MSFKASEEIGLNLEKLSIVPEGAESKWIQIFSDFWYCAVKRHFGKKRYFYLICLGPSPIQEQFPSWDDHSRC